MRIVFCGGEFLRAWMFAALLAAFGAGCSSMQTPAPVLERSPNASRPPSTVEPAAAPPPAAPVTTAPAGATQATSPPQASAPAPAAAAPAAPASQQDTSATAAAAAGADEPIIKPYREGDWRPEFHVVKKGDTLYSIALDYGLDYRELAAWNNLEDPALIRVDQRLRLFPANSVGELAQPQAVPLEMPPAPVAVPVKSGPKARKLPYSEQALAQLTAAKPNGTASPAATTPSPPAPVTPSARAAANAPATTTTRDAGSADAKLVWEWPAQGNLLYGFGEGPNQKGVGIEGRSGQAVLASAPGKVVYSGSGLRGYGKLIIIKHNTSYLSVYAHNSQILVKEGQSVAKGQKIAEMGNSDSDRVALHFEIRRLGRPIDPLQYLPARNS